ncbi:hypothetical protein F3Y22_tig00112114pilonHSYRG00157 [Hibiscus syriacus]|uniref:Uncharacterized protein n=1 Tax=Hibiscus syriacus TaxID=106335 RepID=A0A6A2YCG6_HIBSY|nr:hypothetical protein F3Y22_tig00112114pilonHSYRG00157 [Hibiscus syriacus]
MSSAGSGIFSGFTKLCKGLAVILVGEHNLVQLLPVSVTYLALIPARTIPFGWNLITAGYIDTLGLLFMGKLLEPVWGSKEFLKFIFIINFLTSVCVFVTAIVLYYVTMEEKYLYLQRKPESKLRGDPSEEFAFSTFFPEFLLSIIDPIASIFHRMLCGKSEVSSYSQGYILGGAPLLGSDPIEASRRRMLKVINAKVSIDNAGATKMKYLTFWGASLAYAAEDVERGARALEERLASEKLAAERNSEEAHIDASDRV